MEMAKDNFYKSKNRSTQANKRTSLSFFALLRMTDLNHNYPLSIINFQLNFYMSAEPLMTSWKVRPKKAEARRHSSIRSIKISK